MLQAQRCLTCKIGQSGGVLRVLCFLPRNRSRYNPTWKCEKDFDRSKAQPQLFILGGYPFSDAQWLPVLDICDIKCEPDTEICVENDDLIQRCNQCKFYCLYFKGPGSVLNRFFEVLPLGRCNPKNGYFFEVILWKNIL
jgi:hypothetical protein